ncbi:MAG TPA: tetratricopeptide repeat protein [Casimicrobiaceae bacterium]|nr:tetratricopeptide repeat protein [Casimicrobiaceae bacterium]
MTAINVTHANFDQAVLRASATRPVLVDFWAPWCAPCRALAPILDRLADEYTGRFTLAKLNTEDEPELAARYGVRGIPNCKLFVDGEVIDEFTGALPEGAVRDFLANALPSPATPLVAAAKALLASNDAFGALAKLDDAYVIDPRNEDALLTRIEALLVLNRAPDANAVIAAMEASAKTPIRDQRRFAGLKARAALAAESSGADLVALAQKAGRMPVDCAAKLSYARALAVTGDYERALAELIAIVRTDRKFEDDIGRRTMLTVFDALPVDSDLVRRYRRELAAAIS